MASILFFALSVGGLAVRPGRMLEEQTRALAPAHALGLSASEERGRVLYGREGCAYCHTQQIRFVAADVARFGAPTLAWESRFDYPHLWGTRRIGPDLARAGGTRSDDWHYGHLYAPRAIVPESVMPAFPALFDGAPDRPRQTARDLVAYLQSLGRAREVAGAEADVRAHASPHEMMRDVPATAPLLNASPARPRRSADAPPLAAGADEARGRALYAQSCAGCHGAAGRGDGPGAAGLRPRPASLADRQYTQARLSRALWNGVPGTAMPAWRDHSLEDLAAIARVVRGLHAPAAAEAPLAADSTELARGAVVYAANCVQCHGPDGDGAGTAARALRVQPTDFRAQRPSLAATLRALREGVEGTSMASWTDRLNDADLRAAAHYVRTLFRPDEPIREVR